MQHVVNLYERGPSVVARQKGMGKNFATNELYIPFYSSSVVIASGKMK
jgi:hypothetical protein